jgi:chemotaxis protein MotB
MRKLFICCVLTGLLASIGCVSIEKYTNDTTALELECQRLKSQKMQLKQELNTTIIELSKLSVQFVDLEEKFKKEIQAGKIIIKQYDNRIVLNIDDKICFESGSATLSKEAIDLLSKLAKNLAEFSNNSIFVEGNTDDVNIIANSWVRDNWELSVQRAVSVVRYLEQYIEPKRLSAIGHSKYRPIKPNDSEVNKQLNRRVDIVIIP